MEIENRANGAQWNGGYREPIITPIPNPCETPTEVKPEPESGEGADARKRTRKTLEQQIEDTERRLKKLRARKSMSDRKERDRRRVRCAGIIEETTGVQLDEEIARWIGSALQYEMDKRPEGDIGRHLIEMRGGGGAE